MLLSFVFFFFKFVQATAEANNLAAVAGAKTIYTQLMEEICGGQKPYLSEGHLEAEHLRIRDKAIFQVSSLSKCMQRTQFRSIV